METSGSRRSAPTKSRRRPRRRSSPSTLLPNANSGPDGIVTGPDGNLWITEYSGNRVASITTAGVLTEYTTIPTANSQPQGVGLGPDGHVWFAESAANKVARLTTAGVFTEYGVPTATRGPVGIAGGPGRHSLVPRD